MELIKWIDQGLKRTGKTITGLGAAVCGDKTVGSKILNGTRQVKVEELPLIAAYLEETSIPLFDNMTHDLSQSGNSDEFDEIVVECYSVWREKVVKMGAEEVLEIARSVYADCKGLSLEAKKAAIRMAFKYETRPGGDQKSASTT